MSTSAIHDGMTDRQLSIDDNIAHSIDYDKGSYNNDVSTPTSINNDEHILSNGIVDRHDGEVLDNFDVELVGEAQQSYRVYWQRWLMLATFCALSCSNGMAWLTYASVSSYAVAYYNVSPLSINMMAVIYEVVYVACALFAGRITQKLGLRNGMWIGAALNAAGAIIRVLPWPFVDPRSVQSTSYGLAVFGQLCCGSAQLFTLATPVLIAENWFPASERVTATGLGALSNQIGLVLAFATQLIVLPTDYSYDPYEAPIQYYIITHGVIMLIASLSVFLFFRAHPPTPPSPSADKSSSAAEIAADEFDLLNVVGKCLVNWNLWLLLLAFGAAQGTSYAVATLIVSFMGDQNYTTQESNIAGLLLTVGGVISPLVFGFLADKTRRYKLLICIAMFSTTIFSIFMPLIDFLPHNTAIVQLFAFLLGFCIAAILPLALDVSVEVTYPLPPAVTSTLCMIASNGAGVLLTFLIPQIQLMQSDLFAGWFVVVYMGVSSLLFLPFNAKSRRLELETETLIQRAAALSTQRNRQLSLAKSGDLVMVEKNDSTQITESIDKTL